VLVCGGILLLPRREKDLAAKGKFLLPYINARYFMPVILLAGLVLLLTFNDGFFSNLFNITSDNAQERIPMIIFLLLCIILTIGSVMKNLSLIPVLGLLSCCYLLTGMSASNWAWFSGWLAIGLVVYFIYGFRKSKLASDPSKN
jgi:basic amino acid/polyamine antiporter, APA family